MYGPVAGSWAGPTWRSGVVSGTASAKGKASLYRNSGSGAVRWKVTVPALSLATIPRARSQCPGVRWHWAAPAMPAYHPAAAPMAKTRSIAWRKSSGRTGVPLEYRMPGRRWKV